MAKKKKGTNIEVIDNAVELTERGAKAALNGAVQTAELTEDYVQGLYKLGYDTNVEGLKIAKNYWDTASKIRQDWIKLFAATGEQAMETASTMEIPYQDKVMDMGKDAFENVQKTVSNLMPKTSKATK